MRASFLPLIGNTLAIGLKALVWQIALSFVSNQGALVSTAFTVFVAFSTDLTKDWCMMLRAGSK
jgi:hypothetical protein